MSTLFPNNSWVLYNGLHLNGGCVSEEQNNIRKNWLRALAALLTMNFVFSIFFLPKDPAYVLMPPMAKMIAALMNTLVPLGFNYIVYHCAYKKMGTKLLTFLLIVTPIALGASLAVYFMGTVQWPRDLWVRAYMVVSTALSVWWYVLNWKMRALNKSLRAV